MLNEEHKTDKKSKFGKKAKKIIETSRAQGWVLEPDAKEIMTLAGLGVPASVVTDSMTTAKQFLKDRGAPVVIKAVSKKILHKTEHNAVVTGIKSGDHLGNEMERLLNLDGCKTVLVEEMVDGIEVIVGAKNDYQFGPVVVFGIGGTSVEIYNDTAIRMAPLSPDDVASMVDSLTANQIILGYRGRCGINLEILTHFLVNFSYLVMDLEDKMESIDLNPVMCTKDKCVIADAGIILQSAAE
ncbi:MAG: acetate--CoA ligase family protein [Desulfobacula sp.]|nr:acetate--CoA ligase family protein [Desulfobacula sp.]